MKKQVGPFMASSMWKDTMEGLKTMEREYVVLRGEIQKIRWWLEANAPELLEELENGDTTYMVADTIIDLLNFYVNEPVEKLSALDQMQQEAAEGKIISPNEFMVRVLDDMIEEFEPSMEDVLARLEEKTEELWGPVKQGQTNPSERFKKR